LPERIAHYRRERRRLTDGEGGRAFDAKELVDGVWQHYVESRPGLGRHVHAALGTGANAGTSLSLGAQPARKQQPP
jgi:hypothetical protein